MSKRISLTISFLAILVLAVTACSQGGVQYGPTATPFTAQDYFNNISIQSVPEGGYWIRFKPTNDQGQSYSVVINNETFKCEQDPDFPGAYRCLTTIAGPNGQSVLTIVETNQKTVKNYIATYSQLSGWDSLDVGNPTGGGKK